VTILQDNDASIPAVEIPSIHDIEVDRHR
jgi:hypothetical protein